MLPVFVHALKGGTCTRLMRGRELLLHEPCVWTTPMWQCGYVDLLLH